MAEITTVNTAPKQVQDLFNRGLGAMERGNIDYAIDMFLSCIDIDPALGDVRKYLRAAVLKKHRGKKTNKLLRGLSTLKGSGSLVKGIAALKQGKPLEAIKLVERLLATDPTNMQFITLFCDAADAAGLSELGIQLLNLVKDSHFEDPDFFLRLGKMHEEMGNMTEARECYERLQALKPNDGEALRLLKNAMALESMSNDGWDEAAEEGGDFHKILKDRDEAGRLEAASKAVRSDNDTVTLIAEMEEKIEAEPQNVNYYRALANLHAGAGNYGEAIETLQGAQECLGGADPEIDATIVKIGLQQYDAEIRELQIAEDEEGVAAKRQERSDYSFQSVEDRVAKYPNDLQLRFDYGEGLFQRDMLKEAIQQFQLSQKNPQRRLRSLYYLGVCFKQKGQLDMALEQLALASENMDTMDNEKKDVIYEMGLVMEAMGDPEGSRNYFKQIYSADINFRDVAERVEG